MDAMQLAQLKRQAAWHDQGLRHAEHDLEVAKLAVEGDKKKAEDLQKKVVDLKRKSEEFKQQITRAQDEVRKDTIKNMRR